MLNKVIFIVGILIATQFVSAQTINQGEVTSTPVSPSTDRPSSLKSLGAFITIRGKGINTGNFASGPIISTASPVPNVVANGGAAVIQTQTIPQDTNQNSYLPKTPTQTSTAKPAPVAQPQGNAESAKTPQSCVKFPNTYWTGSRCSCRVGFKLQPQSGLCVSLSIIRKPAVVTCNLNELLVYGQCVCIQGYYRNDENTCIPNDKPIDCPENSYPQDGDCVCKPGYKKVGAQCELECGPNSNFNGFECICNAGFRKNDQDRCEPQEDNSCPPFSERRGDTCVCIRGFREIKRGVCSQCEEGAILINGQCVYTCGVNQQFNRVSRKCECKQGFAIFTDGCTNCPPNFFIRAGYCVACPINTVYNKDTNTCDCPAGFQIVSNVCVDACRDNQQFDQVTKKCKCVAGTALLANGQCGLCAPNEFLDPVAQKCGPCPSGQVFQGGKCVCSTGFGIGLSGACVKCDKQNERLFSGYCVVCPNNRIWSGDVCVCPSGLIENNGVCTKQCLADQLIDANGQCYSCLINEQISGTSCVCKDGFLRDPVNKFCLPAKCAPGQFLIQGICATCPLGAVYSETLKQCTCPDGFFRNLNGICEKTVITCTAGFYLNAAGVACVPCPTGCSSCAAAGVCTTCTNPAATIVGGLCVVNLCGNGFVDAGETCDDGNRISGDGCSSTCQRQISQLCGNGLLNAGQGCDDRNNIGGDGCSANCQVEAGFTCTASQPSICIPIINPGTGLEKLSINFNSVTIYVSLKTSQVFTFASEQEMLDFIKTDILADFTPISRICRQKAAQKDVFDCMFVYGAGKLPTQKFNIGFSYFKDGVSGNLTLEIVRPTAASKAGATRSTTASIGGTTRSSSIEKTKKPAPPGRGGKR